MNVLQTTEANRRNRKRDRAELLGQFEKGVQRTAAKVVVLGLEGLDWATSKWPGRLLIVLGVVAVMGLAIGFIEHTF